MDPKSETIPTQRIELILPVEEYVPHSEQPPVEEQLRDKNFLLAPDEQTFLYYLQNPATLPKIDLIDQTILALIIHGVIGTGAQRGSLTRILNTHKERFPLPDTEMMRALELKIK